MKFLNEIDGASKLKQDGSNRLVTDVEKASWNSKAEGTHTHIELHNHTNKSVIDKFSEVDNKPYYNGAEIGGAVPNLTLNELTLGGRFKLVYNDVEDSLDIEVV